MALKLIVNISKKIPGPEDYSSVQASCSIEGELGHGQDPAAETARLYATAEAAVDRQLGLAAAPTSPAQPHLASNHRAANPAPAPAQRPAHDRAPRPVPSRRRGPPAVTQSQLGLITKLLERTGASLDGILAEYRVGQLADLDVGAASRLIDELKAIEAGSR